MKPAPENHTRVYCREANGTKRVFDVATPDPEEARQGVIYHGVLHGVVVSNPVLAVVNTEHTS